MEQNSDSELAKLSRMNWHGVSLKFSNHYLDRQSKDLSIFKSSRLSAIKAAQNYENLLQKKQLQEYDHAQKLLKLKKSKEKVKHLRLVTLLANHVSLETKMTQAAICIQKQVRGYLIRKRFREELMGLERKRLAAKVEVLAITVAKCVENIREVNTKAAIFMQKNVRKFLAVRRLTKVKEIAWAHKENYKLAQLIKIQAYVRGYLARKLCKKLCEERNLAAALDRIRKRLLILRLKKFWHQKKFVWETVRKKYSDFNAEVSSFSEDEPVLIGQISFETAKLRSRIHSVSNSNYTSKHNTVLLKEVFIPKPPKPPKPPQQLLLKYLQPTESYKNRLLDNEKFIQTPSLYKGRSISGHRFQRNTNSRLSYIKEVKSTSQQRALSADYKRQHKPQIAIQGASQSSISEFMNNYREIAVKSPLPNLLLKKLEESPSTIIDNEFEKVYVYNAPKPQSLSFKDALPDVNSLLEIYAKSLKKY